MATHVDPRRSGSETRARILDVSLALFEERSYSATPIREIAERVGVTQPALYYHFGSKEGILTALVEPLINGGVGLLDRLSPPPRPMTETWRADALAGYYDLIADHLAVYQFVEIDRSVRSHPVAGHVLADHASRFLLLLAGSKAKRRRIGAAAAMGSIRRALRVPDVDPVRDRETILACAAAAVASTL